HPPQRSQVLLQIVLMGDVGESLRHQFLAVVPDDVAQPLIDLQPTAIRSHAGDADSGVLEDSPEPRLAIAGRLDVFLTLAQSLGLVVRSLAGFPAGGFIYLVRELLRLIDRRQLVVTSSG